MIRPPRSVSAASMLDPAGLVDQVLELPIFPSFSRIGAAVRSRVDHWSRLDDYDLSGKVMLLTGATSGIGLAAAAQLARCGASLILVGRTAEKNERVVAELEATTGNHNLSHVAADMGDYAQVRALAADALERHDRLDALLHNAGTLSEQRKLAPDGTEATVASQVAGPFLLTSLLLERLQKTTAGRVITMSSGGMYTAGLSVDGLQLSAADYQGAKQYALAKRAQVTLNEMWPERPEAAGVFFHALHPGWADTPGVEEALPTFGKLMGPLLRTPAEGADTMVWLAADDAALESNGGFWLDRRPRSIHKVGSTRSSDTPTKRAALWEWVAATADGPTDLSQPMPDG